MNLRISGLLAISAFALAFLGSVRSLAQNAYITNSGSNNVSVIDTATNTVIATIPVGSLPYGAAVAPDGSTVYVTNQGTPPSCAGTAAVSVIAATSSTVTTTIAVGSAPEGVAVTPDGS
jgi:YVTN family beta-propeller protein